MASDARRTIRRVVRWSLLALLIVTGAPLVLFIINGLWLGYGQRPFVGGQESIPAQTEPPPAPGSVIKVLSYNIAKAFAVNEHLESPPRDMVHERLHRIAEIINDEQPDIVFFSEILLECCLCPVNQLGELQRLTGLEHWAFGENFNMGLPWYRVISGNAILSRWPLTGEGNPDLPGRKPFYIVKNNRRVLMCSIATATEPLMLVAIHNNTYNKPVNHQQVQTILDMIDQRPALIAGDFNAQPNSPSINEIRDCGRFCGAFAGPATFPSDEPSRTIDYIFAPRSWELIDHRAICDDASDHCAIVSSFNVR